MWLGVARVVEQLDGHDVALDGKGARRAQVGERLRLLGPEVLGRPWSAMSQMTRPTRRASTSSTPGGGTKAGVRAPTASIDP